MGRTTHRPVVLLATAVAIVMALGACRAVTSGAVSSAYDVAGMLACDPKDLPGALSQLGALPGGRFPAGSSPLVLHGLQFFSADGKKSSCFTPKQLLFIKRTGPQYFKAIYANC